MLHVSALFEPSSGIHFKNYCFDLTFNNLYIVKHNLLPVNTTIILIIIVLVLIHN